MRAAANLFIRLGLAVAAFFLVVLAVLLLQMREFAVVIGWPYFAVVGLMLYGWYGVLGLTLGSWALNALIGRLPEFSGRKAAKAAADVLAGAAVSWGCYGGNSLFLSSGIGVSLLYAALVRLADRIRRASREVPSED